ncbi:SRPBCC family protein [Actinomadura kijaniata]|uniref:Uncharacterized protein YndB with AHSA1/START domain n=1 Tax=Actinomadura namibiensis TaxID=182080 RepID=A0A7W3LI46_ACTNM|nr:SRPBCC family protein [Actinomadura namibiensis]MBA8948618.1 uncharacterized protein YndB with AHSA1/START domain [Actinomadura namibiensis]
MIDIDRTAPVVVRHEIVVAAPPETVWNLHTAVDAWPAWNTGIDEAALNGPLREGATFTWLTHGLDITSTVRALEPGHRVLWGGPAHGIEGEHVWTFLPEGDGTRVVTEESWAGPPVEADPEGTRAALDASLTAWLNDLKTAAETR